MTDSGQRSDPFVAAWRDLGRVVAAHVVMLRDVTILDDPVAAALLTALDGVSRGDPPPVSTLGDLVETFDERLDALVPAGAVGAAGVARGRAEVVAALLRLGLRDDMLGLLAATNEARRALLDLAADHVFTLMPAVADGQAAQPTTVAHFLGGVICPLGRAANRLHAAYADVNRGPLGAVALASSSLPIERERIAALLGFDGLVTNTYDAVSATDHVATAAAAAAATVAALRRFLDELLSWLRTDPASLRLAEPWSVAADPAVPQLHPPLGLTRLVILARQTEGMAAAVASLSRDVPYGPATTATESLYASSRGLLADATTVATNARELLASGLDVNRAYLANRAGRDHTTSGELAEFLMLEEALDPASARNIAHLTTRRALEQAIEASGITPQMIDAAALLVVGRELGVEVEAISRYLAPRRFVERRVATGAPAPPATRAYLDAERAALADDDGRRADATARLAAAQTELDRASAEIVATVD